MIFVISWNSYNLRPMKILMVCLGNICRSPLAEGVMKKLLDESNIVDWEVDSAGIGNWHNGDVPDPRAIAIAKRHGIDITGQRARQISRADFDSFDYIFTMDLQNYKDAIALTKNEIQKSRIHLLMDYAHPDQKIEVPDPYYSNLFEQSYQLILEGCQAILFNVYKST